MIPAGRAEPEDTAKQPTTGIRVLECGMDRHRRIAANQRAHPDLVGSAIDIVVDHRHGASQGQLDDMRSSSGASAFFTIPDGDPRLPLR